MVIEGAKAEWERYEADLKAHELRVKESEPQQINYWNGAYLDEGSYLRARAKWEMESAMSEPNKPGYDRANND